MLALSFPGKVIFFEDTTPLQLLSFAVSIINLCSKVWGMFLLSERGEARIVLLSVSTWLSVDVLLEFTNVWAFKNNTGPLDFFFLKSITVWNWSTPSHCHSSPSSFPVALRGLVLPTHSDAFPPSLHILGGTTARWGSFTPSCTSDSY